MLQANSKEFAIFCVLVLVCACITATFLLIALFDPHLSFSLV